MLGSTILDHHENEKPMPLLLPIGSDNFGTFIEKKFDFVDKSLFIQEVFDNAGTDVTVLTRPRRFGKTTALSMLHYFLAPEILGRSTKGMFDNLKIAAKGDQYLQHQGKYPVIFVTLKGIKANTFDQAMEKLVELFVSLFESHRYLIDGSRLSESQKKTYQLFVNRNANRALMENGLFFLTECLYTHFGVKPWVLLDEYDSPLHAAYAASRQISADDGRSNANYFDEMVGFMRGLLGALLKTNPYLDRSVLTGILRISRESMFSGLNNVKVYSILDDKYAQHFGFTQAEVDDLLEKSNLYMHREQVKAWYNGYQFGNQIMYNPWSINNFIDDGGLFDTYWVNTSDNQLIQMLLQAAPLKFKIEFEQLLAGKSLEKNIDENLVFRYLHHEPDAIWSLLLFGGYLKPIAIKKTTAILSFELVIPNQEVRQLYHKIIAEWLADGESIKLYTDFISSLITGDIKTFEQHLARILQHIVSYHDFASEPEAFYHGLMLGFTASLSETYIVQSNRESGTGRFDIALIPRDPKQLAILMELKIAKSKTTIKKAANDALAQIEAMQYAAVFDSHKVTQVIKIGIGFRNKQCVLVSAK